MNEYLWQLQIMHKAFYTGQLRQLPRAHDGLLFSNWQIVQYGLCYAVKAYYDIPTFQQSNQLPAKYFPACLSCFTRKYFTVL